MKNFLKYSQICWATAGDPPSGTPPAGTPPAGTPPAGTPPAGTPPAGTPPAGTPPAGTPPAGAWWESLDPALKGTDEKTTAENLTKAAKDLKGYRDRDATRLVPQTPEGYLDFEKVKDFKIDDKNKPHFDALKTDPAFKAIAVEAHKRGIGQADVMAMYQTALNVMGESGMLEAPLDAAAEKAALVPEAAKNLSKADQDTAVLKRMTENYEFLSLMQTNKALPKDVSDYAEMMLGDSAKGHQFLEWVRGSIQGGGGGPGAHGGGGGGSDTKASLMAEMAEIEKKPGDPKYKEKMAALDEKYKKLFPE